jgi:CRP-like cAMP-binding protein
MITVPLLKADPTLFEKLAGTSPGDFDRLQQAVGPVWAAGERNRLSRPDRQRAIGGGRAYRLDFPEQLLMTLLRLRQLLTIRAAGALFGVDKSTASRNMRRMLAAMSQLGPETAGWPGPPLRGKGRNLEQLFQTYPDLQALVIDAEQSGDPPPKPSQLQADFIHDVTPVDQPQPPAGSVELLAKTSPFQNLSSAELKAVRRAGYQRRVARHAFFYHQGDPASTFYILVEGQVRLTEVTTDGDQLLVRFAGPGEAIGIIAALEDTVYPLAAQAAEDCLALAWDSTTLEQLMERIPRIAINGLRLVSRRWHELQERYRELATQRVERRVAQTLLRLISQAGRRVDDGILIDLPLTRQDLAEMTGTTLYTVSRILSRWEQVALVESGRERVLIRYPHGLARLAEDLPAEATR